MSIPVSQQLTALAPILGDRFIGELAMSGLPLSDLSALAELLTLVYEWKALPQPIDPLRSSILVTRLEQVRRRFLA